jgi:hypothetical protein
MMRCGRLSKSYGVEGVKGPADKGMFFSSLLFFRQI